jgi:hypothetical protein
VDVQVEYRLPSPSAIVNHQTIAIDDMFLLSQSAGDNKELSQQPSVIRFYVGHTNNVSVGHNEYVDRRTRIDIVKGCHILILI